jgi:ABC-2 type transport system ATP-binding protein
LNLAPSTQNLLIETIGLGRDYGATRALDALDLHVPAGSCVGLLGPNGAGKTTALLILSTLLAPSRGIARISGADVTRDRSSVRRRIGLVFQEPSIDGLLSVRENLRFAGRLTGLGGRALERAVDDAIARTNLGGRASQPARQLSGGWRRLTDLARALMHKPDVLILDEPTVGLDPEHRDLIWRLLDIERQRGAAVLFSTHYLAEAETCDRVILLAKGRVVADDAPAALRATIGDEVIDVDLAHAPLVLDALRGMAEVRLAVRTERGCRIGVAGQRPRLAVLDAVLSSQGRVTVRPATLDDVYFARTQPPAP